MLAIIEEIISAGDDIKIIHMKPAAPFAWQAGQYIDISFAGLPARSYSIANAPGEHLEIHIKRGTGEASQYVMDGLGTGEEVKFEGPFGNNIYHSKITEPILAIAGGLGIAPIKAMIDEAAAQNRTQPFTLYWGTYTADEKYLESDFETLAGQHEFFHYHPVAGDHVGDVAVRGFETLEEHQIYISGSPAMIGATLPLLRDKGAQPSKIGYDRHPEADKVKA